MVINILLGILLLPILLINILGPIFIKRTQKLTARINFDRQNDNKLTFSGDSKFLSLNQDIEALGFEYVASSSIDNSHAKTDFSLYSHSSDNTCAMLVSINSNIKSVSYIEFSQLYQDGSMLDVSNSAQVSAFPKMNIKLAVQYPEVRSAKELYSIFLRLKDLLKNSAKPIAYDKSKGLEYVERFMADESDELVKLGYCHPEIGKDGKRLLTWKGAYLITLRSVFPGNKFTLLFDRILANKLLARASLPPN